MRSIVLGLWHVLLISGLLEMSEGIKTGCADWVLSEQESVCCRQCEPGNRFVNMCGKDPSKLCTPCEPNTFTNSLTAWMCSRCTQCIGPQIEVKACTANSDTVCGCKAGLRCGDENCRFCVDDCKVGEEPTEGRACRTCPKGTFNDKAHSKCKPWSKSCPKGETLITKGTVFSDIKCSGMQNATTVTPNDFITIRTLLPVYKKTDADLFWPILGIVGISVILAIIILSLWLASRRKKSLIENKESVTKIFQPELIVMMVENEDAYSYHQPEQEQGGSTESISTQGSDSKLIG